MVSHRLKLVEWKYQQSNVHNDLWKGYIERSGLLPLVHSTYQTINRIVITAFVKLWYPETNTLHMPFGEMIITLDDVSALLSIPVVGRTISCSLPDDDDDVVTLLSRTLLSDDDEGP